MVQGAQIAIPDTASFRQVLQAIPRVLSRMGSLPPNPNLFLFLDLPLLECVMWSSGTPNDHLNGGDIPGLTRLRPCALCPSVVSTD
jgi:hypothetical protein